MENAESKTEQTSPPPRIWVHGAPHFQVPSRAPLTALSPHHNVKSSHYFLWIFFQLSPFLISTVSEFRARKKPLYLKQKEIQYSELRLKELLRG